jgi:hypothetical protein
VREGENSTARGARGREDFRVAATWILPTELRRVRKRKVLSCNGATPRKRLDPALLLPKIITII